MISDPHRRSTAWIEVWDERGVARPAAVLRAVGLSRQATCSKKVAGVERLTGIGIGGHHYTLVDNKE